MRAIAGASASDALNDDDGPALLSALLLEYEAVVDTVEVDEGVLRDPGAVELAAVAELVVGAAAGRPMTIVDASLVEPASVVVGSTASEAAGGSKDVGPPLVLWPSEAGMETSGSSVQAVLRDRNMIPKRPARGMAIALRCNKAGR